jgi:hypothetical protein
MTGDEPVSDDEQVLRRVSARSATFRDGQWKVSSEAFNDPSLKPSVNRAILRTAQQTQLEPTQGVCQLHVQQIRAITTVLQEPSKVPYKVDVIPRPIRADNPDGEPENLSHAQVEVEPAFSNPSRFKKLKDALSRLASESAWAIKPTE